MITLLLGTDIFEISSWVSGHFGEADVIKVNAPEKIPDTSELQGVSLFGEANNYWFINQYQNLSQEFLQVLLQSPNMVILSEDSIDRRQTKNKNFLALSPEQGLQVLEFDAPTSQNAAQWLVKHAQSLNITLDFKTAQYLSGCLLNPEDKNSKLSVYLAHQELLKIGSFADGQPITKEMIDQLVIHQTGIDIFKLLNMIAQKNIAEATQLIEAYYESTLENENSSSIRLVALLAEQWRNLLLIKDLIEQGKTDQEIMTVTGWKSGRVFILKKLSGNYSAAQIISALNKLSSLDKELKSSTLPSRVIVDMIISTIN
ncbi:MAG: hypothetical protein R3B41_02655 [Candidatus Doudnabacteria bacterium]